MTTEDGDQVGDPGLPETPEAAAPADPLIWSPRSDSEIAELGPTLSVEPNAPLADPLPNDEDDYLRNIRRAKKKRLDALEYKQAVFGISLPVEQVVEIKELQLELGLTDLAINAPTTTKFADEIGTAGQFQITTQMIGSTKESLRDGLESVRELVRESLRGIGERITLVDTSTRELLKESIRATSELLAMVDEAGKDRVAQLAERFEESEAHRREYRETDYKNRLHGQTTQRLLTIFIIIVLLLVVVVLVWLALTVESLKGSIHG